MQKNNNIFKIKQLCDYLLRNPLWISAFTVSTPRFRNQGEGEGCFTASVMLSPRAKWAMWPQCEFNLTQLMQDELLLKAINLFFNNSGGVYARQNGVGTLSFRDLKVLQTKIIPYFQKYPLLGSKNLEFQRWANIVNLLENNKNLQNSFDYRNVFIEFLLSLRKLNASRVNSRIYQRKLKRNIYLVNWLQNLDQIPTYEQKFLLLKTLHHDF